MNDPLASVITPSYNQRSSSRGISDGPLSFSNRATLSEGGDESVDAKREIQAIK